MEITKKELRKVSRRFRGLGSRVMHAHYNEVNSIIKMFVDYIEKTPILNEFVVSLYREIPDFESDLAQASGYGQHIIATGDTPEEEVNTIYQILKYISQNPDFDVAMLGWGYTSSKKFQDMVEAFGNRLVQPFISHIDDYLMDISTDMGFDEENMFMITINGGNPQVNISNDNSNLTAAQYNSIDLDSLSKNITEVRKELKESDIDGEMKEILLANLNVVESESKQENPQKSVVKTALTTLSTIVKGIPSAVSAAEGIQKIVDICSKLF
ncbi:hypothetical protein D920_00201 [Enterococcus faecalis 13-SD-W-01]|nr:hypothetical protein D920_00201 [Enterococcus faecalis 13-SD-W-01]